MSASTYTPKLNEVLRGKKYSLTVLMERPYG